MVRGGGEVVLQERVISLMLSRCRIEREYSRLVLGLRLRTGNRPPRIRSSIHRRTCWSGYPEEKKKKTVENDRVASRAMDAKENGYKNSSEKRGYVQCEANECTAEVKIRMILKDGDGHSANVSLGVD